MGYELDKLKNLYGVSSASSNYMGTAMPVKPTNPEGTEAYNKLDNAKQSEERAKYQNALSAYNTNLPKYQEDRALYEQYEQARKQRMANTNMYDPAAYRQVLRGPIYSNANPDLVDQTKKFTTSKMDYTPEELPNLVSKYFNAAPPAGATGPTSAPASAVLNQQQALDKYNSDLGAYNKDIATKYLNQLSDQQSKLYAGGAQSQFGNSGDFVNQFFANSVDPGYSNEQGNTYFRNGIYQLTQPYAIQAKNQPAWNKSNITAAQSAYEKELSDWKAKNQIGQGAYAFAAKGGHIDLNSLAKKYADGGPVTATADMYKAWNADPDKAAGDAAMKKGDYKAAFDLYKKSADAGNANALANLGVLYAMDASGHRNDVEAAKAMLIAEQKGYGSTDKNSNYYWISQRMTPGQLKAAQTALNDYLHPEESKARQEAEAAAKAKAAADAAAAEAERKRLFDQQQQEQIAAVARIKEEQEAAARAQAEAAAKAQAAAEAKAAEAVDTFVTPPPEPPTGPTVPPPPVYNLGEGPTAPLEAAVAAGPKADDAGVAAVKNIDTGTMPNAPALGGVTLEKPTEPMPLLGAKEPPPVTQAVGNAPANDPVVNAIKSMPAQTMSIPQIQTNPLANLFQSYQQQTAPTAQSAQSRWTADRNNYIRSLYGLGTYNAQAVADWEKNNMLGQGKYKYAEGGAVKTNYADGDLVDLGSDDADTTDTSTDVVGVKPSAYDALLAKYKDVDPDKIAAARADYRAKQQALVDQMSQYAATQKAEKPDKSEMYFRLAQAFLTPGKTGSFGEGLAQAGGVMADYQKDLRAQRRADAAAQLQLGMKQNELLANMSQEDLQALEKQQDKIDALKLQAELARIKTSGTTSGMVPELAKYQIYRQKLLDSGVPEDDPQIQQLDDKIHILTTRAPTAASTMPYDDDTVTMLAQRVIAGDRSALTGLGRSTASMAAVQKRVTELLKASGASPEDIIKAQQNLSQQQKVLTGFASSAPSTQGGQIAAMNMLTGHIAILEQAASALNRGDVAAFNRVKTMWEEETNQPLPNNLGLISQLVGDELQKAAVGGAGGVDERKELKSRLYSGGANYNTIKEAADYASHLASQRVGVLKQQWTAVKLPEEEFNAYLTPATQAVLKRPSAPPARPANVPASAGYSPSQHKWFWKDAQGKIQSAAAQ